MDELQQRRMRVRLLGRFEVAVDGVAVPAADLGSRKGRLLLKALAVAGEHGLAADAIGAVLWPDRSPADPGDNIATLVSRLRRILGAETICGGRDGYRLGETVLIDLAEVRLGVEHAERHLARGEAGLALVAAQRAHDLLGDREVLADEPEAAWAEPSREEAALLRPRARRALAAAALTTGEHALAARVAQAAVKDDPYDESARRLLMSAFAEAGEPARALASYAELRALLAEDLGADPAAETQTLYLAILDGKPVDVTVARAGTRPAASSILVGRQAEVATLRAAWDDAAAGQGTCVLIAGEAGIGKTSLVEELAAYVPQTGGQVLTARCYEAERSLFLQPLVDALAPVVRASAPARLRQLAGDHLAALAQLLPDVAAIHPPPEPAARESADVHRRLSYQAVTALLEALAAESPLLLVLDDLQHAGEATVELLHYLARHLRLSRVAIAATVRAEEGREVLTALRDVVQRLDVGPLSAVDVAALAERAGQDDQADSIARRTRGHTLFVVETLRALASGSAGVPDSLETAVLDRVRRAGPEVEELLRGAAVLGVAFEPGVVASLLGQPLAAVASACHAAQQARLVVVAGRDFEFANDLVQEVLYATTPEPTRRAYHLQAADLLARTPEAVAAHAAAAEDWPRAARAWLLAGQQALARAAASDAVRLLTSSIDAADRTDDHDVRARAVLVRGRAHESRGHYAEAVTDMRVAALAAREAGDRRLEMHALRELGGDAPVAMGLPLETTLEPLRRGLGIATSLSDRAMEADLRARLAIVLCNDLRFAEAVDQVDLAVQAARSSGDEDALVAALDGRKTALAYLGETAQLSEVVEELEPLLRRRADHQKLWWTVFESAFVPLAAGDWSAATARMREAMEVNRRSGYEPFLAWHLAHLAAVARLQGRYDEALDVGRRAVELSTQAPHVWCAATAGAALGSALYETGAVDAAVDVLIDAMTAADQSGAAFRLRCLGPLAEATGDTTTLQEASALLEGITAPPGGAFFAGADCYVAVARGWLRLGEPQRARDVLEPLLAAAARVPWVGPLALASHVDAQAAAALGLQKEAAEQAGRAQQLAARFGVHLPT